MVYKKEEPNHEIQALSTPKEIDGPVCSEGEEENSAFHVRTRPYFWEKTWTGSQALWAGLRLGVYSFLLILGLPFSILTGFYFVEQGVREQTQPYAVGRAVEQLVLSAKQQNIPVYEFKGPYITSRTQQHVWGTTTVYTIRYSHPRFIFEYVDDSRQVKLTPVDSKEAQSL